MKLTIFILACFLSLTTKGQDTLTNETIIKLHHAGFGKDILKSKIINTPSKFDVSLDGMLALKKAGVPDDVINQMISKPPETSVASNNSPNSNQPKLEQGVYYLPPNAEKIELEPTVMTSSRSSGLGAISGIFNSKQQASLSGKEAATQFADNNPKFLFVFDTLAVNDMNAGKRSFSNVRSPNEFLLVKLNVEKNTREIMISKGNNINSSSGIDDKRIKLFSFKKLSKGVYELQAKEELSEGEYCFMFAESSFEGGANKVFDFGITKPKKGF